MWKYGLHPLCTFGSINFIGNRFNFGRDLNPSITSFQALYIASDKSAALQEHLGQIQGPNSNKLSALELSLTNPQSETIVSISGSLESIIDLRNDASLKAFVDLIKSFTISAELTKKAKNLNYVSELLLNLFIRKKRNPFHFFVAV